MPNSAQNDDRSFLAIKQRLEQIIDIFSRYPQGLTTGELYAEMRRVYGYSQTKRNMTDTYFKLLEEGAIEGVTFTRVFRGKHRLTDRRFTDSLDKEKRAYIKLALETVEPVDDISKHHHEVCAKLNLDTLPLPFYIKPESYQKLNTDEEEVETLEQAIIDRKLIEFKYRDERWFVVEPYRLVSFDGIWYLYGRDTQEREGNDHKTWMLEFIDDVDIDHTTRHDTSEAEIDEDLENAHAPYFIPDKEMEVIVEVDKEVAEFFKLKAQFPDQKIVEENEKGLRIAAMVSTYDEILPEIKMWLPHIRVVTPESLREKLNGEVRAYLERNGS